MKTSNGVKIAIFSDSHDNLPNLKKALNFCEKNKITTIIHCGDLCQLTGLIEIWPKKLDASIHFVYGNADYIDDINQHAKTFKIFKIYGQTGIITLENKKIAFTHYLTKAKKLGETQKYDYVFYGHDHRPWEQIMGKTRLVNPGNLAGTFYKATFAILDLEKNKLELIILEEYKPRTF